MKAIILAAGFGSRLRPITDKLPKPLCPFFGVASLHIVYHQLQAAGIDDIAINLHYKSAMIAEFLKSKRLSAVTMLSEEQSIRGTGGALWPLREWLNGDDLLIVNSDIVCDKSLKQLIEDYENHRSHAHLLLLDQCDPSKNQVLTHHQKVIGFSKQTPEQIKIAASTHTFSGIHIVSNKLLEFLTPEIPLDIITVYCSVLAANKQIGFSLHNGYWHDLGTAEGCWQAHQDILSKGGEDLLSRLQVTKIRKDTGLPRLYLDYERQSIYPDTLSTRIINKLYQSTLMDDQGLSDLESVNRIEQCLVYPCLSTLTRPVQSRRLISDYGCIDF